MLSKETINSILPIILAALIALIGHISRLFLKKESFKSFFFNALEVLKITSISYLILTMTLISIFHSRHIIFNFSTGKEYISLGIILSIALFLYTFVWFLAMKYVSKKNTKNKIIRNILLLLTTSGALMVLICFIGLSSTSNYIISDASNNDMIEITLKNQNKLENYYIGKNTQFKIKKKKSQNSNYSTLATVQIPAEVTLKPYTEIVLEKGTLIYYKDEDITYLGEQVSAVKKQTYAALNNTISAHLVRETKVLLIYQGIKSSAAILVCFFFLNTLIYFIKYKIII